MLWTVFDVVGAVAIAAWAWKGGSWLWNRVVAVGEAAVSAAEKDEP